MERFEDEALYGGAAGGGKSDPSEWPRSVCNAAALSARRTQGTATGGYLNFCPKGKKCKRIPNSPPKIHHPLGGVFLLYKVIT